MPRVERFCVDCYLEYTPGPALEGGCDECGGDLVIDYIEGDDEDENADDS